MVTEKQAALDGTVGVFLAILTSRLTRYDKKLEQKGQGNIHRLALWFEALNKVDTRMSAMKNNSSPEALNLLKSTLNKEFNADGFSPVTAVLKMIDEFIKSGKAPKYASVGRLVDRYYGIKPLEI